MAKYTREKAHHLALVRDIWVENECHSSSALHLLKDYPNLGRKSSVIVEELLDIYDYPNLSYFLDHDAR